MLDYDVERRAVVDEKWKEDVDSNSAFNWISQCSKVADWRYLPEISIASMREQLKQSSHLEAVSCVADRP